MCRVIRWFLQHLGCWQRSCCFLCRGEGAATGSHPVADANGWSDGEGVPIDYVLANAKRIAESTELPLTVDFEGLIRLTRIEVPTMLFGWRGRVRSAAILRIRLLAVRVCIR